MITSMISGKDLVQAGTKYLGTAYEVMDCQKFFEKALSDCGIDKDLGGSNSWYRYIADHGWVGTPEECKSAFGHIPVGAALFIREEVSESTPGKFRNDGVGDITHIGMRTGNVGTKGKGALHSSKSKGGVVETGFQDKTVANGGWNRVGLWLEQILYEGLGDGISSGTEEEDDPFLSPDVPDDRPETAVVVAETGDTVKMRAKATQDCNLYWDIPVGSEVTVLKWNAKTDRKKQQWSKIFHSGRIGYMITSFLREEDDLPEDLDFIRDQDEEPETTWTVVISGLNEEAAKNLANQYPNSEAFTETVVG